MLIWMMARLPWILTAATALLPPVLEAPKTNIAITTTGSASLVRPSSGLRSVWMPKPTAPPDRPSCASSYPGMPAQIGQLPSRRERCRQPSSPSSSEVPPIIGAIPGRLLSYRTRTSVYASSMYPPPHRVIFLWIGLRCESPIAKLWGKSFSKRWALEGAHLFVFQPL